MLKTLTAGDTLKLTIALADFSAVDGWVLNYRLTARTGSAAAIVFSSAGTSAAAFSFVVAATQTATWPAGEYNAAAWVNLGAERFSIASECGQVTIRPDPASLASGTDTRTAATQALAAIRAVLAGRATDAVASYVIQGRELRYYSVPELIKLESYWANQAAIEDRAAGITNPRGAARRILLAVR